MGAITNLGEGLLKAVKVNCVDCSGGSRSEAARCIDEACPFFEFRALAGIAKNEAGKSKKTGVS